MVKHVEEMWVTVDVGVSVHTEEVGGGPDSGGSAVSETKDDSAVASCAAVDTGDIYACRAMVVSSSSALSLCTERLKDLVPALGSLEAGYTCRGVIAGRVDDGVFGKDGDPTVVSSSANDRVVSASVRGFAD